MKSEVFTDCCCNATHFSDEQTEVQGALTGGREKRAQSRNSSLIKLFNKGAGQGHLLKESWIHTSSPDSLKPASRTCYAHFPKPTP